MHSTGVELGQSARETTATRRLEALARAGATARLSVDTASSTVSVYLWSGKVVAAESEDDAQHYGRILLRQRLASSERVETILQEADAIHAFGLLFTEVPDAAARRILVERFYQCLCEYVASDASPAEAELGAVFVDNLQLGHDTKELVGISCAMADTASKLQPHASLVRGPRPPATPLQRVVLTVLGSGSRTVGELLDDLPLESVAGRACLLEMLESGSLVAPVEDEDLIVEDTATYSGSHTSEIPLSLLESKLDSDLDLDSAPDVDIDIDISRDALSSAASDAALRTPPPQRPPSGLGEQFIDPVEDEDDSDLPTVATKGTGQLTSLKAWMHHTSSMADDDMEAFNDHDYSRGEMSEGNFSTDSHNLDRVEVVAIAQASPGGDEPTARFSAPMLAESEAADKLDVANDVLCTIARAFDSAEGPGRGRSALQLLVDGSPLRFAPVLSDLTVKRDGKLPLAGLLSNLRDRPPTEHRQLLNQTLLDLLERTLSYAADELPEDTFDTVLEAVAGYRQRLGR